jgi:hypothetical protein
MSAATSPGNKEPAIGIERLPLRAAGIIQALADHVPIIR